MQKTKIGKKFPTMAMPVCLAGANVGDRPNYCTIAWFTIIDDEPAKIGLVMAKERQTKDGIVENGCFSVNIPGTKDVKGTDYCGIHSGYDTDKSKVFETFYGDLRSAPMIAECPINIECRLDRIVEFEGTDMVIGLVQEVYVASSALRGGKADAGEIDQLLYLMSMGEYRSLGKKVADAFQVGKGFKPSG